MNLFEFRVAENFWVHGFPLPENVRLHDMVRKTVWLCANLSAGKFRLCFEMR